MTITLPSLLAFSFAMFVLAATPGPAFFALTARSMSSGTVAGVGVVVGIAIADLIYFALALIGITALSEAIGNAFILVKIAGGGYLIWLGIQMWRAMPEQEGTATTAYSRRFLDNFLEGLAVNLTNPKAIVFFAALLPTFFYLPDIGIIDAFVLTMVIVIVGSSTDLIYVLLATRARKIMKSHRSQIVLNRIAGTTLIGVGATVASR